MNPHEQERVHRSFNIKDILDKGGDTIEQPVCRARTRTSWPDPFTMRSNTPNKQESMQKYSRSLNLEQLCRKQCKEQLDKTIISKNMNGVGHAAAAESTAAVNFYKQDSTYIDGKRKKSRTVFSRKQIYHLETVFDLRRYLSSSERSCLAQSLGLSEAQIKIWFQNRRNKWKRQWQTNCNSFGNNHSMSLIPVCSPRLAAQNVMREVPETDFRPVCCHNVTRRALHPATSNMCHCQYTQYTTPALMQPACFPNPCVPIRRCSEDYSLTPYYPS